MEENTPLHKTVSNYGALKLVSMIITLVSVFSAFSGATQAEVIYTPVGVTKSGNASFKIDLNHDGLNDFVLRMVSQQTTCGISLCRVGSAKIKPATTVNGVVVSQRNYAAVLGSGVPIDGSDTFYLSNAAWITRFVLGRSEHLQVAGYPGLEFQINGETHYGWAQIQIYVSFSYTDTTLVGFAYETVPGQAINTGQTSDAYTAQSARDLLDNLGTSLVGPKIENQVIGY